MAVKTFERAEQKARLQTQPLTLKGLRKEVGKRLRISGPSLEELRFVVRGTWCEIGSEEIWVEVREAYLQNRHTEPVLWLITAKPDEELQLTQSNVVRP